MIYLSRNFVLREVIRSNTAERKGIDNTPTQQQLFNACALAVLVGQPLRDYLGKPIAITSWYRCPALNAAVGGVPNSSHITGGAFDLRVNGMSAAEIIEIVRDLDLPVDQAIAEGFNSGGRYVEWTHISIPKSFKDKPRREFLIASGDRDNPTFNVA